MTIAIVCTLGWIAGIVFIIMFIKGASRKTYWEQMRDDYEQMYITSGCPVIKE